MTANNQKKFNLSGHSEGFTLVELIIVTVVIGIIAAIAIPSSLQWRSSLNAGQSARAMVNVLMEARSKAIAANYQYKVEFDIPNGQYRMQKGSQAYNTPNTGWTTVSPYDYMVVSQGVTMRSGNNCTSTATVDVQFNANGTAKLETPVDTFAPAPITVCIQASDSSNKRITVSTSGRISLD